MTDESLCNQLYFAIICDVNLSLDYMLSHAHPKMVTNSLHFVTFVLKFVTELLRKEKSSHARLLLTSYNIRITTYHK